MKLSKRKAASVTLIVASNALMGSAAAVASTGSLPVPSASMQAWQQDEIGVIIHFNMATMAGSQGCSGTSNPPDISQWSVPMLDTEQWVDAMENLGAKYAVYVAKHGCGFCTWPTNVSLPFLPGAGGSYTYSVAHAANTTDVAGAFVQSCRRRGIKPGFYYSLGSNAYAKESLQLSDDDYNELVLAQTKELWSAYGDLGEIWFDGGYSPTIKSNLSALIESLQPNAAVFQGYGVSQNPTRWIGTEAGTAPYPNWSSNNGNAPGGGSPAGSDFVPGEVDTTLQDSDQWFYHKGDGIRTLQELQEVYHNSVGRNANLLLDIAPTPDGVVDDAAFARYKEFGDWIRGCYGESNIIAAVNNSFELDVAAVVGVQGAVMDRVVLQEDQSKGEVIAAYTLQVQRGEGTVWLNATSTDGPGLSVGNKRIHLLTESVPNVTAVRVVVTNVTEEGAVPQLRRLSVVGPDACGAGPGPVPHVCAVPQPGQRIGLFETNFGANIKWQVRDAPARTTVQRGGAGRNVYFQLDGLSATRGSNEIDLCLTATSLPPSSATANFRASSSLHSPGAYTNATALDECRPGALNQTFQLQDLGQVVYPPTMGCFDCAYCQNVSGGAHLNIFSPCWTPASPNEEYAFDPLTGYLNQKFNSLVVGVCEPTNA